MREVRRDDGELCGYVALGDGGWQALTLIGVPLGEHDLEVGAHEQVLADGLRVLADRWTLVDAASGAEEVVCIQQVSPDEVTVALGYFALPGVPTRTLPAAELAAGRWRLEHRS